MRKLLILFLWIPVFAFAQKNNLAAKDDLLRALQDLNEQTSRATFNSERIPLSDANLEKTVHNYFKSKLPEIQKVNDDIKLLHKNTSRIGNHFHFQQTSNNIPIYGATFNVSISFDGLLLSSFNNLVDSKKFSEVGFVLDQTKGEAIFIYTQNENVPAYKKQENYYEVITDIDGNIIRQRDMRMFFSNDDTTVTGKVFLPDPVSSQGIIYGRNGTYQHFNDSDYALLNDQRKLVSFPATFMNDTFYLQNKYAKMVELNLPSTPQVKSKQPFFDFTRSKDGFKDLMAFYHIYATQIYYQSIGFYNLANYQIKADAQSGTVDNSYFYPTDTTLNFGTGGIPDAEDGDIPSHEYTHALSFFINATPNMSDERRAIEEGICDVIAAIRSKKYTVFNWRKIFNFDAPNPITSGLNKFWDGRNGVSSKTYDDIVIPGNPYPNSEIWSSTILDITEQIGEDSTAILMLTSIYSMPYNVTMPQAAVLIMQADSMLHNKMYNWKIGPVFNARKLGYFPTGINNVINSDNFKIYNTSAFADGSGDAMIELNTISNITMYNLQGQKIYEQKQVSGEINLSSLKFETGFYFLIIENQNGISTKKLARF